MTHARRFLLFLGLLLACAVTLTSAQATAQLSGALRPGPRLGNAFGDGHPQFQTLRRKVQQRWLEDAERHRRGGGRVLPPQNRPGPRPRVVPQSIPVPSADYVYFPSPDIQDSRFICLGGSVG